jgi:hypothetical protein
MAADLVDMIGDSMSIGQINKYIGDAPFQSMDEFMWLCDLLCQGDKSKWNHIAKSLGDKFIDRMEPPPNLALAVFVDIIQYMNIVIPPPYATNSTKWGLLHDQTHLGGMAQYWLIDNLKDAVAGDQQTHLRISLIACLVNKPSTTKSLERLYGESGVKNFALSRQGEWFSVLVMSIVNVAWGWDKHPFGGMEYFQQSVSTAVQRATKDPRCKPDWVPRMMQYWGCLDYLVSRDNNQHVPLDVVRPFQMVMHALHGQGQQQCTAIGQILGGELSRSLAIVARTYGYGDQSVPEGVLGQVMEMMCSQLVPIVLLMDDSKRWLMDKRLHGPIESILDKTDYTLRGHVESYAPEINQYLEDMFGNELCFLKDHHRIGQFFAGKGTAFSVVGLLYFTSFDDEQVEIMVHNNFAKRFNECNKRLILMNMSGVSRNPNKAAHATAMVFDKTSCKIFWIDSNGLNGFHVNYWQALHNLASRMTELGVAGPWEFVPLEDKYNLGLQDRLASDPMSIQGQCTIFTFMILYMKCVYPNKSIGELNAMLYDNGPGGSYRLDFTIRRFRQYLAYIVDQKGVSDRLFDEVDEVPNNAFSLAQDNPYPV